MTMAMRVSYQKIKCDLCKSERIYPFQVYVNDIEIQKFSNLIKSHTNYNDIGFSFIKKAFCAKMNNQTTWQTTSILYRKDPKSICSIEQKFRMYFYFW